MNQAINDMNTKLTWTLEQQVNVRAKKYASKKGQSLSKIVENYLRAITTQELPADIKTSSVAGSLRGAFKNPGDVDYKKTLLKALTKKYH